MKMRLSEAILLGAMLRPQGVEDFFSVQHDPITNQEIITSCALGAAYEAVTGKHDMETMSNEDFREGFLSALSLKAKMPCKCRVACGEDFGIWPLESAIPHLNDEHKWTRERIAAWVATIEEQFAVAANAVAAMVEAVEVS